MTRYLVLLFSLLLTAEAFAQKASEFNLENGDSPSKKEQLRVFQESDRKSDRQRPSKESLVEKSRSDRDQFSPSLDKKRRDSLDRNADGKNGGWGSSGGGGGVACFQTQEQADQAEKFLQQGQVLPADLKQKMQELVILDYWDWKQEKRFELFTPIQSTGLNILHEVQDRVAEIAPLYIYRLRQGAELIDFSTWEKKANLARIEDATPGKPLPANCKIVQLAARYTKEVFESGAGPSRHRPVVKIEYDEDLVRRLDPINFAILILHEQMYFLGQMTGHSNSNEIRPMVMRFFEKDLSNPMPEISHQFYMRPALVYYFGDYVIYFADDEHMKIDGPAFSQDARFASFYGMLMEIRSFRGKCDRGELTPEQKGQWPGIRSGKYECIDIAMSPLRNEKWLTDEMAFLFTAYYFLDQSLNRILAEVLMTPSKDPRFLARSAQMAQYVCGWTMFNQQGMSAQLLAQKTLNYCKQLVANLRAPMEKDQN